MTAAAAAVPIVDGDALIAKAKKILAENRGLTGGELQEFRDGLYRLMERREQLAHDTLKLVCDEIDRRASERAMNAIIGSNSAAIAARVAHDRAKPDRWRALTQLQRAALIVDEELGGTGLAKAFQRFVALVEDQSTANRPPPSTFEPDAGAW